MSIKWGTLSSLKFGDIVLLTYCCFNVSNKYLFVQENEASLEELQKLFEDMFEADFVSSNNSSTYMTYTSTSTSSNNCNSSQINIIGKPDQSFHLDSTYHNFCLGVSLYIMLLLSSNDASFFFFFHNVTHFVENP